MVSRMDSAHTSFVGTGYLTVFVTLDTLDFTQLAVLAEKGSLLYNVLPIPMIFMLVALLLPLVPGLIRCYGGLF